MTVPRRSFQRAGLWAVLLAALWAGGPPPARAADPPLLAVEWHVDQPPQDAVDWQALGQALLRLTPGDPLAPAALAAAGERLRESGHFAMLRLQVEPREKGAVLHVRLRPYPRIRDIRVQGAYPLFDSDIRRRMRLEVGAPLAEPSLGADREALLEFLQAEGFVDPRVTLRAEVDAARGLAVVRVDLAPGRAFHLTNIAFAGNQSLNERRLTAGLQIWRASLWPGRAGRFRTADLQADVASLAALYRREGFAEAAVQADADQDGPSGAVRVVFRITEGPRYDVAFRGNTFLDDDDLEEVLVLVTEGNGDGDRGLQKSVRRIRARYREEGFLEARVDVREEPPAAGAPPARRLVLDITEGPRSRLAHLKIEGAREVDPARLRDRMRLKEDAAFRPQALEDDRRAVLAFYWQEGFPDVRVETAAAFSGDRRDVDVTLTVEEGQRQTVAEVAFQGLTAVAPARAREALHLQPGAVFQPFMVASDENTLAALVAEEGYPHVQVTGTRLPGARPGEVRLVYEVREGPRVTVGALLFTGHLRTREEVLRRELELTPGGPFRPAEVLQAERRLYGTDLFESVQVRPQGLAEHRTPVPLLTEVRERPPYLFELEGGLQSDAGVYARSKLMDRNLGGRGKTGWVAGEVSQIGYRAETGVSDPRLLGTRLTASLSLFAEERDEFNQDFRTTSYGASAGVARRWGDHWSASLNLRLERREQTGTNRDPGEDDLTAAELADLEEPRYLAVVTPGVRYDSRDSFIRPTRGLLASMAVDISQDLEKDRDDFLKYRGELRGYWTPWRRLTLAGIGRLGYLDPFHSPDDIPDDQLFYLGGLGDVRGFGENLLRFDAAGDPVGGRRSLSGSLEARIDVSDPFALTVFLDAGRVDRAPSGAGDDDWRTSAGLGLHYQTPIGPVGLVYGWKLDRQSGEDAGELHFSIGYTF